jgi:hypothetical protein
VEGLAKLPALPDDCGSCTETPEIFGTDEPPLPASLPERCCLPAEVAVGQYQGQE